MYALKRMHLDIKNHGSKCSSYSKIKNDPHETLYQRQILDLRQSTPHFRPSLNFETTPNFRPAPIHAKFWTNTKYLLTRLKIS